MLRRLVLSFAVVVALGTAQGLLLLSYLEALGDKVSFVASKPIVSVDRARAAWSSYQDAQIFLADALDMIQNREAHEQITSFEAHVAVLDEHLRQLAGAISAAPAREKLEKLATNVHLWKEHARVLLGSAPSLSIPTPHLLTQIETAIRGDLETIVESALSEAGAITSEVQQSVSTGRSVSIVLIVVCVIAGLGLALFLSLAITRPLMSLQHAMREIASGNLEVEICAKNRRDEIGRMAVALEVFRANTIEMKRLDLVSAEANEKLVKQGVQLQTAMSNMRQGLVMFDADQRLLISNQRYAEMYGLSPQSVQPGMTLLDLLRLRAAAGTFQGSPDQNVATFYSKGNAVAHVSDLPDGRAISIAAEPMNGGGWVATHEDITERKTAEAKIEYMAHHDALTGLPNRTAFKNHMKQALSRVKRGQQLAVHCLDLDRFKFVNDMLGHAVGDALLQDVSRRLANCLRDVDSVARLGGDEFVVLQENVCGPEDAATLAERIINAISQSFNLDGNQINIGVSIGTALAPHNGLDTDQLMRSADMALYRAKEAGRGVHRFFEPEMDREMQARRSLESDLREAVALQQFELFFQPIVAVETGQLSGFEALLRWRHPKRGLVAPAEFITVCEEIGLIVPIGTWVLKEACKMAATWPEDTKLSVNISPTQFRKGTVILDVMSALAASGLSARRLEIEITETVLLQDTDETIATLNQLKGLGVRIAMDDFGTGYSSLGYLRKFPFDRIKIDQSFVRDLNDGPNSMAIIRAVTGLGSSLGISTTAEGVETAEQLRQIRAEGCTEVQGYFLSKPIPAQDLHRYLMSTQSNKSNRRVA